MTAALPQARTGGRLAFLDALRGLSALWVVLFHFLHSDQFQFAAKRLPAWLVDLVFEQGHLGVWVFFVVSGFVMALAVEGDHVDRTFAWRFTGRRLLRLAVPYYVSLLFVVALVALRGSVHSGPVDWPTLGSLAAHAFFMQPFFGIADLNIVYWSLVVEVQFYLAFIVLVWTADSLSVHLRLSTAARESMRQATFLLMAVAALAWPVFLTSSRDWGGSFLPFWFAFLAGVLACRAWRSGRLDAPGFLGYVALLLLAGIVSGSAAVWLVALTAVAIAAVGGTGRLHTALDWRPLQWTGLISYSLYLLHDPLITAAQFLTQRAMGPGVTRDGVALVVSLTVCLAAAACMWRWVERPSQAWSRLIPLRSADPAAPRTRPQPDLP